jgi:hypothetical protein
VHRLSLPSQESIIVPVENPFVERETDMSLFSPFWQFPEMPETIWKCPGSFKVTFWRFPTSKSSWLYS